jgi:hypothetical protein
LHFQTCKELKFENSTFEDINVSVLIILNTKVDILNSTFKNSSKGAILRQWTNATIVDSNFELLDSSLLTLINNGGGTLIEDSNVNITNSVFTSNKATNGGAINYS